MCAIPKQPGMRQMAFADKLIMAWRDLLKGNLFALQKCPLPELQGEEGKYLFGIIGAIRIGLKQSFDSVPTEKASVDCHAVRQHVADEILEVVPKPRLIRHGEAGLFAVEDRLRNSPRQGLLQNIFC